VLTRLFARSSGWMVVQWLIDWLIDWIQTLMDRFISLLRCWACFELGLFNTRNSRSVDESLIGWVLLIDWLKLNHWLVAWVIDWMIESLIGCLIDWLFEWLFADKCVTLIVWLGSRLFIVRYDRMRWCCASAADVFASFDVIFYEARRGYFEIRSAKQSLNQSSSQ
jgi:hypothetical protein